MTNPRMTMNRRQQILYDGEQRRLRAAVKLTDVQKRQIKFLEAMARKRVYTVPQYTFKCRDCGWAHTSDSPSQCVGLVYEHAGHDTWVTKEA